MFGLRGAAIERADSLGRRARRTVERDGGSFRASRSAPGVSAASPGASARLATPPRLSAAAGHLRAHVDRHRAIRRQRENRGRCPRSRRQRDDRRPSRETPVCPLPTSRSYPLAGLALGQRAARGSSATSSRSADRVGRVAITVATRAGVPGDARHLHTRREQPARRVPFRAAERPIRAKHGPLCAQQRRTVARPIAPIARHRRMRPSARLAPRRGQCPTAARLRRALAAAAIARQRATDRGRGPSAARRRPLARRHNPRRPRVHRATGWFVRRRRLTLARRRTADSRRAAPSRAAGGAELLRQKHVTAENAEDARTTSRLSVLGVLRGEMRLALDRI